MELIQYIKKRNPWHKAGSIETKFIGILRPDYLKKIEACLTNRQITAILGIRRCGKSTLIYQTISELLKKGVNKEKILYVKIDDIISTIEDFDEILSAYQQLTGFNPEKEEIYVFVDEIQRLNNWQEQFKRYIDYKYEAIFIVSGSSRSLIYKDASESLVGRIQFINVFPLTFREFLEFNGINIKKTGKENIKNLKDIQRFYNNIDDKEQILYYFRQYLKIGGFPEWFDIKDKKKWQILLRESYINLMLYRDIVSIFNVKHPTSLERLFSFLSANSSNRFSYNSLAQKTNIDKETVKLYLYYLESAQLIIISEKFSKSGSINERSEKKIYVWEEGLRRSISFTEEDDIAYENLVLWHLQKTGIEFMQSFKPYYGHKKYEVDYIFALPDFVLPIEIKNSSSNKKLKGLRELISEQKLNHALVITKDLLKREKEIMYIPLWLFLLYI